MLSPWIVHLNGPEYGVGDVTGATSSFSNINPGVHNQDYFYDTGPSLEFLRSRGWTHVKLPIRWERIQASIYGPLRGSEVELLAAFLDRAATVGLSVIVDVHNYGIFYEDVAGEGVLRAIGSTMLPVSAFSDLWSKLARELGGHPAVVGYATMAEPQEAGGLTSAICQQDSRAPVEAIRTYDVASDIPVAGFGWSSAAHGTHYSRRHWILDPVGGDLIRYESLHYFDSDWSGEYFISYS